MGVSLYDKEGSQRRIDAMYVLTTAEGVQALLVNYKQFSLMPYERGDYGAVDTLIVLEQAMEEANLTHKQRQALQLVYIEGYTQKEVAKLQGVSQQSVAKHLATATQKIADVYKYWEKRGAY